MLPSFAPVRCPVLKVSARLLGAKQRFNKVRFQLAKNLRSARCSPFVISKVLPAPMGKLITARARKNKCTARMLANARKDHSIPLMEGRGLESHLELGIFFPVDVIYTFSIPYNNGYEFHYILPSV